VLDATDLTIRREIRSFSSESSKVDVALVFYAGHGAQVNGENYILPIDIDIPRTETDIQLSALKVDDLVNSIRAPTKIVFLDACRDNPALFKNMIKGRGASQKGLAPANASAFEPNRQGGGIFIAYATDSGSVALDGSGQHSPFTQALLRNLEKRISIDDMFSLVTREVRLVTKNNQRPYKYASLENIVCLAGGCSGSGANEPIETDLVQQVKMSESEELQIALQTNTVAALDTYLQRYPSSSMRAELTNKISWLRLSQLTEWTLFEIGEKRFPQYMKLSSAEKLGNRIVVQTRSRADISKPIVAGRKFPDGVFVEDLSVLDCAEAISAPAERSVMTKSGEILYHYKWGDPQFLNLAFGTRLLPGSIGLTARTILCYDDNLAPLIDKSELDLSNLVSLSSTSEGDAEIYYFPLTDRMRERSDINITTVTKNHENKNLSDLAVARGATLDEEILYRYEVVRARIYCIENKISFLKNEAYDENKRLVYIFAPDPSLEIPRTELKEPSPFGLLRRIACSNLDEGSK
jgi:hypothetical protein